MTISPVTRPYSRLAFAPGSPGPEVHPVDFRINQDVAEG